MSHCNSATYMLEMCHYHAHWITHMFTFPNAGLGRRTFPILRQTASWMGDHFMVKPSAIGQPTWPTQPSIPQGSANDVVIHVIRYVDYGVKA